MRKAFLCLILVAMASVSGFAQRYTAANTEVYVNENITTFLISGEKIKMIDISADIKDLVGNQPGDNLVRLKPVKTAENNRKLGVVTVVGERSISQFDVIYVSDPNEATTKYNIRLYDQESYINPAVEMSSEQLYNYCWKIMDSDRKFYDVSKSANKITIRLNNLYTVGGYFFFDISVENRSNIRFDIEDVRIRLSDKRQSKATNVQDIELVPVMQLNEDKQFRRGYRNIYVLEKLTFPDEKVLTFTMSEEPISGRTIELKVDYSDVLNADAFDDSLIR